MTSKYFACAIAVMTVVAAEARAESGLAYEENKLNYQNCQGEKVTARWYGEGLSISNAGTSPADPAATIEFKDWEGACKKLAWNQSQALFSLSGDGGASFGKVVRYIAWDGGHWIATRTGHGFYVSRVGQAGKQPQPDDFSAAAAWIRRSDPSNFGAITLTEYLSTAVN